MSRKSSILRRISPRDKLAPRKIYYDVLHVFRTPTIYTRIRFNLPSSFLFYFMYDKSTRIMRRFLCVLRQLFSWKKNKRNKIRTLSVFTFCFFPRIRFGRGRVTHAFFLSKVLPFSV